MDTFFYVNVICLLLLVRCRCFALFQRRRLPCALPIWGLSSPSSPLTPSSSSCRCSSLSSPHPPRPRPWPRPPLAGARPLLRRLPRQLVADGVERRRPSQRRARPHRDGDARRRHAGQAGGAGVGGLSGGGGESAGPTARTGPKGGHRRRQLLHAERYVADVAVCAVCFYACQCVCAARVAPSGSMARAAVAGHVCRAGGPSSNSGLFNLGAATNHMQYSNLAL